MHMVGVPHFYKGDNFYGFLFAFLHTNSFWKRIYSKRKEFAPHGVDPFLEGDINDFNHYENMPIQIY